MIQTNFPSGSASVGLVKTALQLFPGKANQSIRMVPSLILETIHFLITGFTLRSFCISVIHG